MSKNPYTGQDKSFKYRGFEKAYKETALPLMKFLIKRMGGDQKAAEEVFSRTAEAALKSWYSFENKSSFFTWVCRIGLNKVADYYRDQIHERSKLIYPLFKDLANIEDKNLSHEERLAVEELRSQLNECLNILPYNKRQMLQFRYWEDMTLSKIANKLGISERAAEGKLYRARLALKEVIVEKYPHLK